MPETTKPVQFTLNRSCLASRLHESRAPKLTRYRIGCASRGRRSSAAGASLRQDFSEVNGLAKGQLSNLLTATETIGYENRVWAGGLHGGEQALIGDGLGDFKFAGFEAERAGHSAAAGLDEFDIGSG